MPPCNWSSPSVDRRAERSPATDTMSKFKRVVTGILLLGVFLVALLFTLSNTTPLPLALGMWQLAPLPLGVWVLLAFTLGGLLGLISGAWRGTGSAQRREFKQLQARLHRTEQELQRLQAQPRKTDG